MTLDSVRMSDASGLDGLHAYAAFTWELIGVEPRRVRTEALKAGRAKGAYEWRAAHRMRFDPARKETARFLERGRCVVEVYSAPGGLTKWLGGGTAQRHAQRPQFPVHSLPSAPPLRSPRRVCVLQAPRA